MLKKCVSHCLLSRARQSLLKKCVSNCLLSRTRQFVLRICISHCLFSRARQSVLKKCVSHCLLLRARQSMGNDGLFTLPLLSHGLVCIEKRHLKLPPRVRQFIKEYVMPHCLPPQKRQFMRRICASHCFRNGRRLHFSLDSDRQDIHAENVLIFHAFRHLKHHADADVFHRIVTFRDLLPLAGIEGHAVVADPKDHVFFLM